MGDFTLHITDVLFGITMIYCLAGAIESLNAKLRWALKTHGHIRDAVWLCLRVTLSYRDVEDLPAERGLMISYESIRRSQEDNI